MIKKSGCVAARILGVLMFVLIFSNQAWADEVTIIGRISDSYQVVAEDGAVYDVAGTDMGNDMVRHIGKIVEAKYALKHSPRFVFQLKVWLQKFYRSKLMSSIICAYCFCKNVFLK